MSNLASSSPSLDVLKNCSIGWKTYIEPLASKYKLISPAVTNSGAPGGIAWCVFFHILDILPHRMIATCRLDAFMAACTGCTFDGVAIHWYGGMRNSFKVIRRHRTDCHSFARVDRRFQNLCRVGQEIQPSDLPHRYVPGYFHMPPLPHDPSCRVRFLVGRRCDRRQLHAVPASRLQYVSRPRRMIKAHDAFAG